VSLAALDLRVSSWRRVSDEPCLISGRQSGKKRASWVAPVALEDDLRSTFSSRRNGGVAAFGMTVWSSVVSLHRMARSQIQAGCPPSKLGAMLHGPFLGLAVCRHRELSIATTSSAACPALASLLSPARPQPSPLHPAPRRPLPNQSLRRD